MSQLTRDHMLFIIYQLMRVLIITFKRFERSLIEAYNIVERRVKLKVHYCRFENLATGSFSHKNNILKISHF